MKTPSDTTGGSNALTELTEEQEAFAELQGIARKVREWQQIQRPPLSDNKLCAKFAGLGSQKTYQLILNGKVSELNVEKQLASYRATWEQIIEESERIYADVFLDALGTVSKAKLAALEARAATDNTRFVLIEGDTGCGKTMALRGIATKYKDTVMIEASAAWKDSPSAFLTDLAIALGGGADSTLSQAMRLREVKKLLGEKRRIVCIDEGHELGPKCLNTLRTLINASECVFVVAAMHTLWERLENKDAYEEARQLTGNRLQRRVKLNKVSTADAARLIQEITGMAGDPTSKDTESALAQATAMLVKDCQRNGNLKFISRCAKTAKRLADSGEVDLSHIAAAKVDELGKR